MRPFLYVAVLEEANLDEFIRIIETGEIDGRSAEDKFKIQYQCKVCEHISKRKNDMVKHVEFKHMNRTYQCKHCPQILNAKFQLLKHLREFHGMKMLKGRYSNIYFKKHYGSLSVNTF